MTARAPKVILITGASSGIGAAVARESARLGHHLVLTARRADRLEAVAEAVRGRGAEALVVPDDLADPAAPGRLVTATIEHFGGLDVLVNNAGHGLPHLFAQADPEAIQEQLQVVLVAPIVLARRALPYLIDRRGTVINVGSAITCVANPALGAYGAAKAGLAYWNDALRREVAHRGVRVCLVEPGPVATEFFEAMDAPNGGGSGTYNPMRDAPPRVLTAPVDEVARRIVGLIDRPRQRLSVLRRVVWPHRMVGALFQMFPRLGDLAVSSIVRHLERRPGGAIARGSPHDVRSPR